MDILKFQELKTNKRTRKTLVHISKENDWLKIGANFTVLGLSRKIIEFANTHSITHPDEKLIEIIETVKTEIINSTELGKSNDVDRNIITGNDMI